MATGEGDIKMIECGFCLSKNENLQQPVILPCSHIHCQGCLTSFYDKFDLLQCPLADCRLVLHSALQLQDILYYLCPRQFYSIVCLWYTMPSQL